MPKYEVGFPRCNCHPETCNHFAYYVWDREDNTRIPGGSDNKADMILKARELNQNSNRVIELEAENAMLRKRLADK